MLSKLSIRNFALIDELSIPFSGGLNILTGETGAGKSIIMGALSMILGERAESKSFYNPAEKSVIEGQFDIAAYNLKEFFQEYDLDYDTKTTLRRELTPEGKSRSFINDTPVNLSTLKFFAEKLVDIHSQHETLDLNRQNFQLMVVDVFCDHQQVLTEYRKKFRTYKTDLSKLKELEEESLRSKNELDYLQFQFNELEEAGITATEQEILENELLLLTHSEQIKRNISTSLNNLSEGEFAVVGKVKETLTTLQSLEKINPEFSILNERLKSLFIELKDIIAELESIDGKTGMNESRLNDINERLNLIYKLEQKHHVKTTGELLEVKQEIEKKLNSILFIDDDITKLQESLKKQKESLQDIAQKISSKRNELIPKIETSVMDLLKEVSMPQAQLKIENKISPADGFHENGLDEIRFLFCANTGGSFLELHKVASGGELSRLMLAMKSLIAKHTALPTIVFDEIDTGISGEVALKVGNIMDKLASSLQVITITHLPQIASKGSAHYFVYKEPEGNRTRSKIKLLNHEERIVEIAKMLSGNTPTESAIANAKELIHSN